MNKNMLMFAIHVGLGKTAIYLKDHKIISDELSDKIVKRQATAGACYALKEANKIKRKEELFEKIAGFTVDDLLDQF